ARPGPSSRPPATASSSPSRKRTRRSRSRGRGTSSSSTWTSPTGTTRCASRCRWRWWTPSSPGRATSSTCAPPSPSSGTAAATPCAAGTTSRPSASGSTRGTDMLKMVLIGAVAVPAIAAGSVAATGVVVVDVKEARDGSHIVVPVPLALAQAAAAFVPDTKTHVRIPAQAERYLPGARQVLAELANAPDAELVSVEEREERVSIRKEGDRLRIHVEDHGEEVNVQVPISLALSVLPEAGGRITASDAVWALQHARMTQIVDVQGRDGEHVSVTVY